DLRLYARHARDARDLGDLRGAEESARGEARPHPEALAGDGDLAQHEAIAAFDEARDPLGHGPQGHEPTHAHRDPKHGEQMPARHEPPPAHDRSRCSVGDPNSEISRFAADPPRVTAPATMDGIRPAPPPSRRPGTTIASETPPSGRSAGAASD